MIDASIHFEPAAASDLYPQFDEAWRRRIDDGELLPLAPRYRARDGVGSASGLTRPADVIELLPDDAQSWALLTLGDSRALTLEPDPGLAAAAASAINRWTAERWLDQDDRLLGSIYISTQQPDVAAAEIRRVADRGRFVQIVLAGNALSKPFGHPLHFPIFEAATEMALPICIPAPCVGGVAPSPIGGGPPAFRFEEEVLGFQSSMMHFVSFITNGTFEQFPDLRLILSEVGQGWLPALLWRLDADFRSLRSEIPWARRTPSDYARERVVLTTGPIDAAPGDIDVLSLAGAPESLLFASSAPRWDRTTRGDARAVLPPQWHDAVFHRNAERLFGGRVSLSLTGAGA